MNWDTAQGEAKHLRTQLKQKWPQLTDDDLLLLEADKEAFLARLLTVVGGDRRELERQLEALQRAPAPFGVIYLGVA